MTALARDVATAIRGRHALDGLLADLAPIGRDPGSGGYHRFAWTGVDLSLREWFAAEAARRGLDVEVDRNGNQWAWWGTPAPGAVVTGSHLDSVPGGGAFDGPLGVVSALLAVDALRSAGVVPIRPLAVVNFFEEEGARFGRACLGSRLMTGAVEPERALGLADDGGITLAEAMTRSAMDPTAVGVDAEALGRIGVFVELHVEQGRQLAHHDCPVGVASSIWPHGRWRFSFTGEGNHAGTTELNDRRDPMQPFAETVSAARRIAGEHGAVSTFGRVRLEPNATNAIPTRVDAWLDTRGAQEDAVARVLEDLQRAGGDVARAHGVGLAVVRESWTSLVEFDGALRDRLVRALGTGGAHVPVLHTAAGHDAGVLAAHVPTAMLFVRNPTGVSHSPYEHAEVDDCLEGVGALSTVLSELLTRPGTPP